MLPGEEKKKQLSEEIVVKLIIFLCYNVPNFWVKPVVTFFLWMDWIEIS